MSDWNSLQYLKFKKQRTQPATDLLMRLKHSSPRTIVDVGCGPGNSTLEIANCFPEAKIVGIDSSANMIETAKGEYPQLDFKQQDVLELEGTFDLIFSNACLQWVANHRELIPFLMSKLNNKGVLAVQIPMNGEEPLFQIIKEVANESKWGLRNVKLQPNETLSPQEYFDILAGCSSSFDIWEIKYYHNLPNHQALVDWIKGTRIRPYLDCLADHQRIPFENEILERAKRLYPVQKNGEVLLGFRRFFFTAVR
ncbi:methyltransferase domain-containing protein [Fibrobacter intestinalis]|uniref:Trans-aconitate 2-methyltransferase n=1 Tax=Fibrobacter intestinalis TaxID=28122 RepID=A0A1T4LBC7_9BACT|nr:MULTISPECIES: methyltransferase domain-containing protein [Fibrobacter]PBC74017.1 trans-aconitate 2-methyltransferase [Fibrobacter sp. NR9]SJZ52122.1 trans-aconitate 2-methyltransferase [Fibrobacter intestinalis]